MAEFGLIGLISRFFRLLRLFSIFIELVFEELEILPVFDLDHDMSLTGPHPVLKTEDFDNCVLEKRFKVPELVFDVGKISIDLEIEDLGLLRDEMEPSSIGRDLSTCDLTISLPILNFPGLHELEPPLFWLFGSRGLQK